MAVPLVGFASTGGGPAAPITLSFTYTGAVQTWVAPLDVTTATVTLTGAGGGGGYWTGTIATGAAGGTLSGTLAITAGATYYIYCGGGGGAGSASTAGTGGFGGGGNGTLLGSANGGGGGGGYSAVAAGSPTGWVAIVGSGGGGGGANASAAGAGGSATGGTGGNPGNGGTQSAGGAATAYGTAGDFMVGGNGTAGNGSGGGGSGLYGGSGGIGGGGGSTCVCSLTGTIVNTRGTGGAGGVGGPSPTAGANGTVTITYIGQAQVVFSATGANQTWTAPSGVTSVNVTLKGANGGWDGNPGGSGGLVSGTLAVSAGSTYILVVGASGGQSSGQTYYGGGGSPTWAGGSGGGRSAIRNLANTADLVTAGGAGGGSENSAGAVGGAGGGLTGGTGGGTGGGAGGGQAGGGSGVQYIGANSIGGANTAAGGGGWYGGANGGYSGGGGGGSSYVANLTGTVVNTQGANYAAGQIIIAYPTALSFLPTMLTSNVYWFDAADTSTITTSGSTVTAWANKGTASMTFAANTGTVSSGTTTKNGRNVVSFPTSSKLVSAATSLGITGNDETIFVVYQKRSNLTTSGVIDLMTANNPNPGGNPNGFNLYYNQIAYGKDLTTNTNFYDMFWTVCGGYCFTSEGNTPTYSPYVYQLLTLVVSTTNRGFWSFGGNNNGVGGGPGQYFAGCGDGYFTTSMTFNMGKSTVDWDLAEYIVYNRVLNTVERQQIEGYLAWKWNIPLVTSHPYANYQP